MGLLDNFLADPAANFGVGLLVGNRGPSRMAAFQNALIGGVGAARQAQASEALMAQRQAMLLDAQEKIAENARAQAARAQASQLLGLPESMLTEGALTEATKRLLGPELPSEALMAQYYRENPWALQQKLAMNRSGAPSVSVTSPIYNIPKPEFGYQYQNPADPSSGVTIVPGGPADPSRISQAEGAKLREDLRSAESFRAVIGQYRSDLEKGGPALPLSDWMSGRPGRLRLQKGEITSFIGKLRDMGVLQPSDVRLIEGALTDPTSIKANVQAATGGSRALTDPLDYLMQRLDTYIGQRRPYATGESVSAEPGGRPRGGVTTGLEYKPLVPQGTKAPTATNPVTGERVMWNGTSWVPVP